MKNTSYYLEDAISVNLIVDFYSFINIIFEVFLKNTFEYNVKVWQDRR